MHGDKIIFSDNEMKKKILILAILATIFGIRFYTLQKSEHPVGLDGYYYALQAKSFALNGKLENPDTATAYYLSGITSRIFGDAIIGCKIWACLAATVLCFSVFCFANTVFNKNYWLSIFCLVLAGALPSTTQISLNYINNLTANFYFFFFATFVVKLFRGERKIFYLIAAPVLFILTALTHLVPTFYSITFICILAFEKFTDRLKILISFFAAIILSAILYLEKERFNSFLSFDYILPLASPFIRRALNPSVIWEISLAMILAWAAGIMNIIMSFISKKFSAKFLLVPVIAFPFYNLSTLDLGYRILLSSSLCSILFFVYIIHEVCKRIFQPKKSYTFNVPLIILSSVLFAATFLTPKIYNPKNDPPYEYYKKIATKVQLDDDTLLICHLGLNHTYTYYNNLRWALNYIPEFEIPKNKIWRIVYGVGFSLAEDFYDEVCKNYDEENLLQEIDSNYFLIREDLWQDFLNSIDTELAEVFQNWYNPYTVRPNFMRRK